jgi:NitT/TauT family transport system ATP-binding protein
VTAKAPRVFVPVVHKSRGMETTTSFDGQLEIDMLPAVSLCGPSNPDGAERVTGTRQAMSGRDLAIRFQGVGHTFFTSDQQTIRALTDLTFDVARHEFVAIMGPSGCGKSTLLRILTGLVRPTDGKIEVFGLKVSEPRDDVGIVFQKPTLLPWFDVLGNVTFPVRHREGRVNEKDRQQARDLLALVGLASFERRRVHELSGGMQQRVAIARALLLNPDILVMDEPFSALDALTRDAMSFELLRIWEQQPKTVIFITHSIPEAILLADRIVVMTERPGTVRELVTAGLKRPRTTATLSDPRFHELSHHIRSLLLPIAFGS